MATLVVALDGTRVNSSDTNTNWSKLNTGGGAPASEAQNAYQNALAVNVKNTNTASHGGLDYDHSGTASFDVTGTVNPLVFMKVYVADFGALNAANSVQVRLGSDSSNYDVFVVAGTDSNRTVFDTYPPQGGYLLVAIAPSISAWRETPVGTPTRTAIDYFAGTALFTTGAAKTENFAVDAIDIGKGLILTRGDAGSTEAVFQDFVTQDQNTTGNRWGVVYSNAGVIYSIGLLTVGETATATEFFDDGTSIVVFPDGYHHVGGVGTYWDISNVSTVVTLGASQIIGRGVITTSDTRPDLIVNGTSGSFDIDGTTIKNHRNVTFTSVCGVTNADIECQLLTQASADLDNSIIRTNAITSVACLQDPTFGTTTDLHDVDFIQAGVGHAIELSGVGSTYTFTNLTFTGYGANTTDDAALDITAATGTTTIEYSGTAPTYKTAGATVVLVSTVAITITVKDVSGNLLQNVQTAVYLTSDRTEVLNEDTTASGIADGTLDSSLTPAEVEVRCRRATTGDNPRYKNFSSVQTVASGTGLTLAVTMVEDTLSAA
jgi:hypothetical protein